METDEFVAHAPLDAEVEAWIEAGWLLPRQDGAKRNFFDVDLARAHLVHDLERLGVNDEGVILDLRSAARIATNVARPPVWFAHSPKPCGAGSSPTYPPRCSTERTARPRKVPVRTNTKNASEFQRAMSQAHIPLSATRDLGARPRKSTMRRTTAGGCDGFADDPR
jgi:hypothetical protein